GDQFADALFEFDAAAGLDLFAVLQLAEGVDGGLDEVLGAGRTVCLREDVGDADELETGADTLAGGDAGARTGRNQNHRARAAAAGHGVGDGRALKVDLEHLLA